MVLCVIFILISDSILVHLQTCNPFSIALNELSPNLASRKTFTESGNDLSCKILFKKSHMYLVSCLLTRIMAAQLMIWLFFPQLLK